METREPNYLNKYKYYKNKIRSGTRRAQRLEQCDVSAQCKRNPKKFWNYVNSKISTRIGDMILEQDGRSKELTDDYDKAAQGF